MNGGRVADKRFPTTETEYAEMVAWLRSFGRPHAVGVEGTNSYGAGSTRYPPHPRWRGQSPPRSHQRAAGTADHRPSRAARPAPRPHPDRPGRRVHTDATQPRPGRPRTSHQVRAAAPARHYQDLTDEVTALTGHLTTLATQACPQLLARRGVGIKTTAQLLTTLGDNPDHARTQAAYAPSAPPPAAPTDTDSPEEATAKPTEHST